MPLVAVAEASPWRFIASAKGASRRRWCLTRNGPPPYYTLCSSQRHVTSRALARAIPRWRLCWTCAKEATRRGADFSPITNIPHTTNQGVPT